MILQRRLNGNFRLVNNLSAFNGWPLLVISDLRVKNTNIKEEVAAKKAFDTASSTAMTTCLLASNVGMAVATGGTTGAKGGRTD